MRRFDSYLVESHTLYWISGTDETNTPNKLVIELRKSRRYHILRAKSYPSRIPAVYKQLYNAISTVLGRELKDIALRDLKENRSYRFFIQWINGWDSTIYNVREIASSNFDFPIKSRFREDIKLTNTNVPVRYIHAIDCRVLDFVRLVNRVPEANVNVLFLGDTK